MKKCLLLLIILLPLYGCVATTALVIGATAGGAIVYDKRSFSTMGQDRKATSKAQHALNQDSALKKRSHLAVTVYNHQALLVGQTQTAALKQRAQTLVEQIPHVARVYNGVTVAGSISTLQRANDTWLTSKVRTSLLATKGLKSNDIKVVTEAGVVYLMGKISRDQADLATEATRHVGGVIKVVKVFEYA